MADIVERMSTSAAPTALCAHCGRPIIGTPMRMGAGGDVYHAECTLPPRSDDLGSASARLMALGSPPELEPLRRSMTVDEYEALVSMLERRCARFRAALLDIADLKYECGDSECGAEKIALKALVGKDE